jgi:hypothetical protein
MAFTARDRTAGVVLVLEVPLEFEMAGDREGRTCAEREPETSGPERSKDPDHFTSNI